jgi:alpha-tubulin suppressor-like RCC1 family protein
MKRWFLRCTVLALAAGILVVPADRALAGPAPQTAVRTDAMTPSIARLQIAAGWLSGYAIKLNGSLWSWGNNVFGQLGLGDTRHRRLPTRVGRSTGWATIAAGEHCLAVKRDGSLWSWGSNDTGQLGLDSGNNGLRTRPRRVAGADWKAVGVGVEFSVALKRNGSLWTWGNNNLGALGQGNSKEELRYWRPTRVGKSSDWKAIAVGYDWVLALKRDGSLWAWGGNDLGQLGLGTTDDLAHPTPTRVGSDLDWTAISAGGVPSFAIKRDGSLWAWGGNGEGQLGLGDTADRSVPTRVGTGSSWKAVAAAQAGGLALKRDGSLWAWGENGSGQLGLGDKVIRKSPTRVRSSGWAKIAAGSDFSLALKANGSFWAWGSDRKDQLGLRVLRNRLVPTKIASLQ